MPRKKRTARTKKAGRSHLTVKAQTPRKRPKAQSGEKQARFQNPTPPSYEEALLESIMHGSKNTLIPEDAVTFNEILSNLTSGMKILTYRFGIGIGRELYKRLDAEKHYYWYEESIPDLISFMEKSGYQDITYNFMARGLRIRIYHQHGPFIGTNVHTFESGIISGFISTASRQMLHVNEESCSSNGADYCEFISSGEKRYTKEVDISLALENFALRIGSAMHDSALRQNGKINQAYHALSLSPLLNSKYANAINNIAEHMGYKSGAIAFDDRRITPARILDCISKTASLLNFGEPSIKDRKKIDIKFSFSPELSRKEYIDLSLSFMNGIVRRADTKREIYSTIENRGSRYVLHIKERN